MSDATRAALTSVLRPDERVTSTAAAIGCTLVLTDQRFHLVRDRVEFRPRTGIQSWVLDRSLTVRMTPIRQSTGRLIIARAGQTASVFLTAAHALSIEALLADIRRHIYREP